MSNVISIATARLPVRRKRTAGPRRYCAHRTVVVDEAMRTTECEDCGAFLDPVNVVLMFIRLDEHVARLAHERDRLANDAEQLREEIKRLKAAKKRASK